MFIISQLSDSRNYRLLNEAHKVKIWIFDSDQKFTFDLV